MSIVNSVIGWISCPYPRPAAHLRLFCFPYAGGGLSVFRAWWRAFPEGVEVCPILPPGREQRLSEDPFTEFDTYVKSLTAALEPRLDLPYVFFGHSLGAIAAFECTRMLRRNSVAGPQMLFASGCRAPQTPSRENPIHDLPREQFLEELRKLDGSPAEALAHPELMDLLLPAVRADFAVYESYEYRPDNSLDCPIHVFGGLEDRRVTRDDLAGWSTHSTSAGTLRMFPGDHFFLHSARNALIDAITSQLEGRT